LEELMVALERLEEDSAGAWGVMNASQMAAHCSLFVDLYAGRLPVSPVFAWIARWVGRPLLQRMLNTPPDRMSRGMKTAPALRVTGGFDFASEKVRLHAALEEAAAWRGVLEHPLYGPMESVEMQLLVAHHTAHHFRQFNLIR
jgi:hypothetical protein